MKQIYIRIPILFFTALFISIQASAQLKINEYSCANTSSVLDNNSEYNDWVEIYNAGSSAVNLTGYYFSDNYNNPTKWQIPSGSIAAGGFIRIFCSGRDVVNGVWFHSNFKLTQCKPEEIILSDPSGVVLDSTTLRRHQDSHSWGRTTDGAATWSVFLTPTSGTSNNTGTPYQPYATTPVFSLPAGFYSGTQSLTISSPDPGVTIYYTTNGSEPTTSSTQYTGPISISSTQVIRARAFSSNPAVPPSFMENNTYFINVTHTISTVSIYGDNIMTLMNGSWSAEPITGLEFFDKTGTFRTEVTGTSNKHGNDSWAYDQRGIDFVAHDQFGYNDALKWKIFRTKNRQSFQRIIIKAAANDNYPFENGAHIRDSYCHHLSQTAHLKLDERSWESAVLYVNGQYWGVYDIREKVDDADFTDFYYNQDENHLQFLKTWGGTWSEYGGPQAQTDWNNFVTFVTTNNMATQANWNYVDSVYNWQSLADYIILNSICVTSDWLNWNTAWWRGMDPNGDKRKWRYVLWDNDATFGHYINYTGIPDTSPNADPCNPESLPDPGGQGHIPIVNALMNNPTFKQWYINRYADLMNTSFACDSLTGLLDSMIAEITPEMPGQIAKWGGSMTAWQGNVATMRNFIVQRCTAIQQGMIDCYNLTGPYNITIDVQPAGAGTVVVNSIHLDNFVWSGTYYGGIPIILKTQPTSALYTFDHWEMVNTPLPNATSDSITIDLTQPDQIVAVYVTQDVAANAFIATAFSPNGDGNNDMIYVHGIEGVSKAEFVIYNRWGQRVFETTDLTKGWDGKTNGADNPSGVYAYVLKVTLLDGTVSTSTGNITLMR
ncbi:MAG: hypothetical protein Fur0041_17830 [Bacteroidia bacterium]